MGNGKWGIGNGEWLIFNRGLINKLWDHLPLDSDDSDEVRGKSKYPI